MKRDLDLIRKLLFAVEGHPHGRAPHPLPLDGYSEEVVGYHCYLIVDAGLADGIDVGHMQSPGPTYRITRLTSYGHDFIDASRSDTVWANVTDRVKQAGGWTIQLVLQQLVARVAQAIQ